jgi:hypothetical protein
MLLNIPAMTYPCSISFPHGGVEMLATLGEIEFDYHMKKLSEEDYRELKNNYSGTALQILKAQQQIDSSAKRGRKVTNNLGDIDREIEDDLIKLKGKETKGK